MKNISFYLALLLAALGFGAGCDKESDSTVSETTVGAKHVIAVIPKLTNTVYWQSVLAGAQAMKTRDRTYPDGSVRCLQEGLDLVAAVIVGQGVLAGMAIFQ